MAHSDEINIAALSLFEQSLDYPAKTRADWIKTQAGDNAELRDKALNYLSRDENAKAALHTGGAFHDTLDDTAVPDQIGAYKVTSLIGRGGMGAVYRGERASGDFDHDVAIKIIRPGAMSDKLVERFENERQTLARLSHPHIARLYDGGTLENGAPYIVMEFIDGSPITDWANSEALSLEDRLTLFKAACAAVSHAHQNLIIHRDITPSNVLVDASGEVKLIDFGIAKPFDEDAKVTDATHSLASLSFTPGFAAPERSQGAGANTLSDIYSLGKLLDSLAEERKSSSDLKAIIVKATELQPEQRYGSVDALIDDLRHYESGFPIEAGPQSSTYRFKKFIGRHKLGSALASAAIIGLITAFGITAYQYQRAETALVKADKRFNDVRRLATTMMTDIYEKIYRVPGSTEATKELVVAAQIYLDELASDTKAPADVKREAAIGYTKLGKIVGGTKGGSINDLDAADTYFAQAQTILENLIKSEEPNSQTLTAIGKLYFYMSEISIYPRNQDDLAWSQLQTSSEYLDEAVALAPDDLAPKLAALHSNCYSAEVLIQRQEGEKAQNILRDCVKSGEELLKSHPDNEKILRLKSASGRTLANALSTDGKYADAILVLNEAIADLDRIQTLVQADNDGFTLRGLTMAYWRRGYAQTNLEDYSAANDDYAKALDYTNTRLEKDPKDKDANWFFYTIIAEQSTPLLKIGQIDEAESGLITALGWYEERHTEQPKNQSRLGNLFLHNYLMADFYGQIKDRDKECQHYRDAYDFYKLMDNNGTLSQWNKASLKALKEGAVHCDINFLH